MSGHMLVIDDDPDLRETVADLLADAGYRVETAANGAIALELLAHANELPDVILRDMMMPVMDGWAFSEEKAQAERLAHIPVIVLSAHADISEAAKAMRAVGSLAKPVRGKPPLQAIATQVGV